MLLKEICRDERLFGILLGFYWGALTGLTFKMGAQDLGD